MKKIIIIDGNSLAYSNVPNHNKLKKEDIYSVIDNREIYIVRKFIKKLLRYKYNIFPGYKIIVVFDQKDKVTFRHTLDPKYKSKSLNEKRRQQKDYVYSQIDEIKNTLDKLGVSHYSSKDWEADDIIGMLVSKLENKNYLTTIISGDKDILQLISGKTRILYKSNKEGEVMVDRSNVWDISGGFWPDQVIDMKILHGDSSDNIRGLGIVKNSKVEIWSKEDAYEMIKKYDNIDNMFSNIEEISNPYKKSLLKGKEKIQHNRKLVTIVKDWQIDLDFKDFISGSTEFNDVEYIIEDLNLKELYKNKRLMKGIKK